jgi:nucleoside phosphorylase
MRFGNRSSSSYKMLDDEHARLPVPEYDQNSYILGNIGPHNIVIGVLPAGVMGTTAAATSATHMLSTFARVRFGLMVGIGGGVPREDQDIRLGDIVVSQPVHSRRLAGVVQYDYGKTVEGGRLVQTSTLSRPPTILLAALNQLQSSHLLGRSKLKDYLKEALGTTPALAHDWVYQGSEYDELFLPEFEHEDTEGTCKRCDKTKTVKRPPRDQNDPYVHYGIIASGNQVMRSAKIRDKLAEELGVLCFEMEAAGLMDGFPCLVIRGICDYCDSHKSKRWQKYAAIVAAVYAKELLSYVSKTQVGNSKLASDRTGKPAGSLHRLGLIRVFN